MEQEDQHEADLANMNEQRDAHLDGLVTMSPMLSSRHRIDLLANNVSAEAIHDAMRDVWNSYLGQSSLTIPGMSTDTPRQTTPKRPRTLTWYLENVQHSNQDSHSLTSQQVKSIKNKIVQFQNIINMKTGAHQGKISRGINRRTQTQTNRKSGNI